MTRPAIHVHAGNPNPHDPVTPWSILAAAGGYVALAITRAVRKIRT